MQIHGPQPRSNELENLGAGPAVFQQALLEILMYTPG